MYEGIGLETPRGSGTNGYVQRNLAFIRVQKDRNTYKTEEEINATEARMFREPNKEILEHERKRRIENKVVEMEDLMEEQGYNPEEIAEKVAKYRQFLLEKEGESDLNTQKTEDGRIAAKGSHEMRAFTQQKNALFRDAVGISADFVDGTALQKKKEKKDAELVKMITTGKFAILPESSDEEKSQTKNSDDKKSKKLSKKKKQSSKKKRKKKSSEPDHSASESADSIKSNHSIPDKQKLDDRKQDKRVSSPDSFKKKRPDDVEKDIDSNHRRNHQPADFDKRYGWASQKDKERNPFDSEREENRKPYKEMKDRRRRHSPDQRKPRDRDEHRGGREPDIHHHQQQQQNRPRYDAEPRKRKVDERDPSSSHHRSRNDASPVIKRSKLHNEDDKIRLRDTSPDLSPAKRHKSKKSRHTDKSDNKNTDANNKRHKKHDKTKKKRRKSLSLD